MRNSPAMVPTYECKVSNEMGPFVPSKIASCAKTLVSRTSRIVHSLKEKKNNEN